jgi:hypothetical protein
MIRGSVVLLGSLLVLCSRGVDACPVVTWQVTQSAGKHGTSQHITSHEMTSWLRTYFGVIGVCVRKEFFTFTEL